MSKKNILLNENMLSGERLFSLILEQIAIGKNLELIITHIYLRSDLFIVILTSSENLRAGHADEWK